MDVIRSSWYNKHSLMIYLNVSDDVLQWSPNKLNLQGKQKLVSKIRLFEKLRLKLECLIEGREVIFGSSF